MIPEIWRYSCLLARMQSIYDETRRVAEKDHPYEEPRLVYLFLSSIVDALRRKLKRDLELAKKFPTDKSLLRVLRSSWHSEKNFLDPIERFFEDILRSDSPRIPFEFLQPLSWAADHILGGGRVKVIVCLRPDYNYAFMPFDEAINNPAWKDFWDVFSKQSAHKAESERLKNILFLFFPSAEAQNILLHAIAAHEIGHRFFSKNEEEIISNLQTSLGSIVRQKTDVIQEYITASLGERVNTDRYNSAVTHIRVKLHNKAIGFVRELLSDLIAARLIGPVFLAAFDRIVVGPKEPSDTHPSRWLRQKFVREYLEKYYPDILKLRSDSWDFLFSEWPEPKKDLFVEIIEEILTRLKPFLESLANSVNCNPFKLGFDETEDLLKKVFDHIRHLAPPHIAYGKSVGLDPYEKLWFTMFACWFFILHDNDFENFMRDRKLSRKEAEWLVNTLMLNSLQTIMMEFKW